MSILESFLGSLMNLCYRISNNYWISIIFFTAITKILLLPLTLWCQKNSIIMVKIMPLVNQIKIQYFGDEDTISEKQRDLFKKEHYHPLLSLLPLAVQVVIMMGLVAVIHQITDTGKNEALGIIPIKNGGWNYIWPFFAALSASLSLIHI